MNEITDYYRKHAEDQHAKIGALCFARGYARSAAETIAEQWDERSNTSRGRAELRTKVDRLVAVLSIPMDELVAWERTTTAQARQEVDRG